MSSGSGFETGLALGRRRFLAGALAGAAGLGLGACSATSPEHKGAPSGVLAAGSRPFPSLPVGKDMLPEIEHIVVLMLENHSFDNVLGMLGRGDGFDLDAQGNPTATNPYHGQVLHAFHMPTPCQLVNAPSNSWNAGHLAYDGGTCLGFADNSSGPVSMGYYDATDLPFTYGLAGTFPINDRYFCSVMAQTFPNRRFLISGTALGIVEDTLPSALPPRRRHLPGAVQARDLLAGLPRHAADPRHVPPACPGPFASIEPRRASTNSSPTPARARFLPSRLIDPNFDQDSEENPQDIQYGDVFLAQVVNAAHGISAVGKGLVHLDLRRARRVLRSRPASRSGHPRRDSARHHRPPRPAWWI